MTKETSKTTNNTPKIIIALLACTALAFTGLSILTLANTRSAEDKEYIALQDYILERHIQMAYQQEDEWQHCELDSHGLSKDGDLYARFWCQSYNTETHEAVSDKEYRTLYFHHSIDENSHPNYSEALGD